MIRTTFDLLEMYDGIYVYRDDLAFKPPAPPFSKCRGILSHFQKLKDRGVTVVGYVETSISMAGWGVAWACELLNMQAVLYDPQYKKTPKTLAYHREKWAMFPDTKIIPIKAGMAKVNWYICKKLLEEQFGPEAVLLPLGLPFKETIEETSKEVQKNLVKYKTFRNIVCCVGSGTICAGIWKGLNKLNKPCNLYGVTTRVSNIQMKEKVISQKAGITQDGLFPSVVDFTLINSGYQYTDECKIESPFPCHSFYDLKAWEWIEKNKEILIEQGTTLFWNIGQ